MAKKSAAKRTGLNQLYDVVAKRADTAGVKITAAESRRVLACFFDVLEDLKPAEAFDVIAKGLSRAGGRQR
jgi:hypothetical protein